MRSYMPNKPTNMKNSIQFYCKKNSNIFEYQISSTASLYDYLQPIVDFFKENDNVCLIEGNETIYLKKKLREKVSTFEIENFYSERAEITLKYKRSVNKKHCIKFFNTLIFNKIVDHLNDAGDPNISCLNVSQLFNSSLTHGLFYGGVKMLSENYDGIELLIDVSYHLTCQLSLFEFIRREFNQSKQHPDCHERIKSKIVGK